MCARACVTFVYLVFLENSEILAKFRVGRKCCFGLGAVTEIMILNQLACCLDNTFLQLNIGSRKICVTNYSGAFGCEVHVFFF